MQVPEKKNKKPVKHLRGVLLAVLSLTLLAVGGALWLVTRPAEKPPQAADTAAQLVLRDAAQVASITVSAPQGENYTLLYEGGSLWYQGETPFPVDDVLAVDILMACTSLSSLETLLEETPADLSAFGLDPAQCTVTVTYTRGEPVVYHIGNRLPLDAGYYFMLEGDGRLYRVHDDILDTFQVSQGVLYPVEQVRLTASLIDRVTLYDGKEQLLFDFEKRGGSFCMTHPHLYPTDGDTFGNILTALENFRVGAYMYPDTSENRAALGAPQYRLEIREGAGSAGAVTGGVLTAADRQAGVTSVTLWPMGDEPRGYCAVNGGIYQFLKLSLAFLYQLDLEWDALPLQPAGDVTLENLHTLQVNGDTYQILRTERVMANNQLETDAEGNILYDISATKNGQAISLDAFEARLASLAAVTVGGRLPALWQPAQPVTDTLVFTFTDGARRTLTLAPYDALHNAVGVDGEYLFYLIKGGLTF